ncbi:hypothetical protein ACHAXA_004571 [Cyclostephanos tholiformis]|uniref:ACT domain-containing protein n=1 Tax=Cyclostephanos tholiformis TaxID=382380 RepID=A0ABD3RDH1_9STRA
MYMTMWWKDLAKIPIRHPLAFGVGVSTIKTSASDLLVQVVVEKKSVDDVDWKRNAAFATFGFFYLGGVQYALYVPIFGKLFPHASKFASMPLGEKIVDSRGMRGLFGQLFLDQFVHHPLVYFPAFYATRELVMSDEPNIRAALESYRSNMKEDLLAIWKVWIPSMIINFSFMPMWARIPWVAGTSLFWTCILSAMRGGDVGHSREMEAPFPTGSTLTMVREGLDDIFASPVDLDPNLAHFCISGAGPDRVGTVANMARTISDAGGNVTTSKMVRLGQEFITLMHVAIEPDRRETLMDSLRDKEELKMLNIRASGLRRRETGSYMSTVLSSFHLISSVPFDYARMHRCRFRPGMLASIAETIAQRNMSIEDITTEIRRGKNGQRDFVVNAEVITTEKMDEDHLSKPSRVN